MGYSCTNAAYKTFEKVLAAAKKEDGIEQSNTWKNNGLTYFVESPQEAANGAYIAEVRSIIGKGSIHRGFIMINPDGSVQNWPGLLKSFVKNALK